MQDLGSATRMDVEAEIRELRPGPDWAPTFWFVLQSDIKSVELRFTQVGGKGPLVASIRLTERGEIKGDHLISGWNVPKGRRFKLRMDWSRSGVLVLTCDQTDRGAYRFDFVPTEFLVSVSSGELSGYSVALNGISTFK
jgi:hypothetical protein